MYLSNETKDFQEKLARYCRTGNLDEVRDIPGVRLDRVGHYRRLIYNVFESTLRQAFPITYQLLDETTWEDFVKAFLSEHDAKANKIWLLADEFYQFAEQNEYHKRLNIPFLLDLLLFEWVEIEIYTMPDIEIPTYQEEGDLLEDILVFTPEFQIINLHYPVHLYPASQVEEHKGDYYILVFRHPESKEVKFMDISPVFAMIVSQVYTEQKTVKDILAELNISLKINNMENMIQYTLPFLNDLTAQGFIVGFQEKGEKNETDLSDIS